MEVGQKSWVDGSRPETLKCIVFGLMEVGRKPWADGSRPEALVAAELPTDLYLFNSVALIMFLAGTVGLVLVMG